MFIAHCTQELGVLLCGDFNSDPFSAAYELIRYKHLSSNHINTVNGNANAVNSNNADFPANNYEFPQEHKSKVCILPDISNIVHSIELQSIMATVFGNEPAYTNYTANYKGTLDYIFYTPSCLRAASAAEIPSESSLLQYNIALPNAVYPSDHLMLCCEFLLSVNTSGSYTNSKRFISIRK